jgi:hypothetical protein
MARGTTDPIDWLCLIDKSGRFGRLQRRQDAGKPRGEHRFAGAGRADHQEVMGASRGDLERPLGAFLAFDVAEIERRGHGRCELCDRRRQKLRALEMVDDREKAGRGDDLHLAGPRGLAAAGLRADDADLPPGGGERGKQYAGDRGQRTVERQFTDREVAADLVLRQHLHRGEQAQRDR